MPAAVSLPVGVLVGETWTVVGAIDLPLTVKPAEGDPASVVVTFADTPTAVAAKVEGVLAIPGVDERVAQVAAAAQCGCL